MFTVINTRTLARAGALMAAFLVGAWLMGHLLGALGLH